MLELLKNQEFPRFACTALKENLDLKIPATNIDEFQALLMITKFNLVASWRCRTLAADLGDASKTAKSLESHRARSVER